MSNSLQRRERHRDLVPCYAGTCTGPSGPQRDGKDSRTKYLEWDFLLTYYDWCKESRTNYLECDFLLTYYDWRREARANEVERDFLLMCHNRHKEARTNEDVIESRMLG